MSKIKSKKNASGTTKTPAAACRRGFHHLSRAWYGPSNLANRTDGLIDEVMFGHYHADGGTLGEMAMEWKIVGRGPAARLCAFHDAWDVLATFGDVLKELGTLNKRDLTPEEFCAILAAAGFDDLTQTKQGKR